MIVSMCESTHKSLRSLFWTQDDDGNFLEELQVLMSLDIDIYSFCFYFTAVLKYVRADVTLDTGYLH